LNLDPEKSAFFRNAKSITGTQDQTQTSGEPKVAAVVATDVDKRLAELEGLVREPHDSRAILRMVVEAFGVAFGFRRSVVLAPGKDRAVLRVQSAWGEDAKMFLEEFAVPLASSIANDVFSVAWHSGQPVVIADAFDDKTTSRVPRVYYEFVGSAAFVIYPCGTPGPMQRLLFADTDAPRSLPTTSDLPRVNRFRALVERTALAPGAHAPREIRPLAPKRI
jgi:hypothetical protein